MTVSKKTLIHIALIGVFTVLVMASSFYYGLTGGNDLLHHFQLANIVYDSIASHEFYPSLASMANSGYGDVTIRFYPPFSYYLLSAAFMVVGDWYYAGYLTFFGIFFVSGIGAYLWAKEEFSANQALLAAAIYIFVPFHINEIYNNFLYAEFAASAIIPFCFLFITRVCQKGRLQDMLGLSIAYTLLILTHLPLTVISSLVFGVYALVLLKKTSLFQTLLKLSVSIIFSLAASSFYWIRMITELNWVNLSNKAYYTGIFDYNSNFLFRPQNIINFSTDELCLWFADLMLLTIILICIPSFIYMIKQRKELSKFSLALVTIFIFSVVMTTPLSKFIWDNLGFLQKVQFPWRWMAIVSVSGSLLATGGILRASELMNQNKNPFLTIGLGIIFVAFVFTSAFVIKQANYLPHDLFNAQIANIKERTFVDFWWPQWVKPEVFGIKEKVIAEQRETEISEWNPMERKINVAAGSPALMRVATFYYPYWQATLNGEKVKVEKTDDGAMSINLPAEKSEIVLSFQEPYFVKYGALLSFFTWIFFGLLGIRILIKNRFYGAKLST